MLKRTFLVVSAVLVAASGSLFAQPSADDGGTELRDLQRQVEQLRGELAELRSKQQASLSAADVDATVAQVLADSARRSQLLQLHGFTAGWTNERFVLQSEDGSFTLKPSLQLQVRHVTNVRDTADDWETDHGFEMRRVKFSFDGNFMSKNLTYYFLWATQSNGGNAFLEHAWVKYMLNDRWGVRGGQIGNPVIKEQAVSSRRSMAVDRSLTNVVVTGANEAQLQAITLLHQAKPLYVEAGYGDGFVSNNTDWTLPGDWNAFVRADYVIQGDIKQAIDFTARGNKESLLVLGGGLDVTDGPDAVYYRHTADLHYEDAGTLSLWAAYLGNYQEIYSGGSTYDWGLVLQAACRLDERWEAFARYGISFLDEAVIFATGTEDTFHEFTVGANYYLHNHSAKFTVDLTYLPNGSPSDQRGLGFLRGDDTQFVIRSQFQLLI